MRYVLPFRERRRLQDRAYRAQQRDQSEVCGALLCIPSGVLRLGFLRNRSNRPGHFDIAADELSAMRRGPHPSRQSYVGTFHSHPLTEAVPGKGDVRHATVGHLMLIYDVCGREGRLWRIVQKNGHKTANEARLFSASRAGRLMPAPNKPLNPAALKIRQRRGEAARSGRGLAAER
jgi:proteasome lid subunit RPN8/RPN11